MAPSKAALAKAYDAGQAAQRYGYEADGCPFAQDSDEGAAWLNGYADELAEKWLSPGRAHHVEIEQ